jgi:glutamate N-acetyltransferase/amino-acid N-acetyltransferase
MQVIEGGGITTVSGFTATGMPCGIKKNGRPDLSLLYSETPCTVAGVFTKNRFQAPPLLLDKLHLRTKKGQAVITNSGNANAYTGDSGYRDAEAMALATATALGIPKTMVYVASTGVIGEPLPIEKITSALPGLAAGLSKEGGRAAAEAIMTTDTFIKEIAVSDQIGGVEVRIGGMAKGSGMIHPNMATMLAFLTTDANIAAAPLKAALREAVQGTFNAITVDGETSTNDMVLCFANGQGALIEPQSGYRQFVALLRAACLLLAKMIVRDGEGATKVIEIEVLGAPDHADARRVAMMIGKSLLVKTAFFGEDANWGRIVAAIGNAGVRVDAAKVDLTVGDVPWVRRGTYLGSEKEIVPLLKQSEIKLTAHLHEGWGKATIWTSDLGPEYVRINASYRT